MPKKKNKSDSKAVLPSVGAAFAVPLDNGRFGVCRVLKARTPEEAKDAGAPAVLVAPSPWVGNRIPDVTVPELREILVLSHHFLKNESCLEWVEDAVPSTYRLIGTIEPSEADRQLTGAGCGHWARSPYEILMQWRWDHERDAVLAEEELEKKEKEEGSRIGAAIYAKRLAKLTYAKKRKERLFEDWPVDDAKIRESRKIFRDTIDELAALGPKPERKAALSILRRCIERFNELDDGFISTIEREEICEHFDDLVHLTGLKGCDDLADRWRDW